MTENRFFLKDAKEHLGKTVEVKGWVYNKRSSGAIIFLQVRDGTGFIQATVVKNEVGSEVFQKASEATLESSIIVEGILREEPRSPEGFEITVKKITLVDVVKDEYPIGKKDHGPDFLLSNRHLWIRSKRQWAILRIRSRIFQAVEDFYQKEKFTRFDTPIITPNACEGTTTLFELDYFGQKAYLSQSGQLYLEAAIASLGRVYDFEPVFRAEKSKTKRHLTEFWMTNCEMAFCDLEENIKVQEELIMYLIKELLEFCQQELKIIERDLAPLKNIKAPFPRLSYDQCLKKLHELGSDIKEGEDLGNDDETILMNHYKQPLFVTHYPSEVKAFYMKKDPKNPGRVLCADLMAPEGYGEIIGGSQREDNFEVLKKAMEKNKLSLKDYGWYLDLRKYGSVTHSGFGLGIERFIAWVCKLEHVRETIPFPRTIYRMSP
ncbi:MAG: asparagine--tRNA ligase [Patescibacteria group bacterium]|nr:asparagine--tRNA ligase [Patescibacteria group bacterium]